MIPKTQKFRLKVFFICIIVLCGLLIMIASLRYGFGTSEQPGPGLYPFLVGLIVLVTSILELFSALKDPTHQPLFDKYGIKKFSLMLLTFFLWILVMPYLGYVLVTLFATYALCRILNLEGWPKQLGLSFGTALLIYLLFDCWLYIDLPRGILG